MWFHRWWRTRAGRPTPFRMSGAERATPKGAARRRWLVQVDPAAGRVDAAGAARPGQADRLRRRRQRLARAPERTRAGWQRCSRAPHTGRSVLQVRRSTTPAATAAASGRARWPVGITFELNDASKGATVVTIAAATEVGAFCAHLRLSPPGLAVRGGADRSGCRMPM